MSVSALPQCFAINKVSRSVVVRNLSIKGSISVDVPHTLSVAWTEEFSFVSVRVQAAVCAGLVVRREKVNIFVVALFEAWACVTALERKREATSLYFVSEEMVKDGFRRSTVSFCS